MPAARLLVVDDSPEVATLVRLLCRRTGWGCVVAESAEAGLTLLEQDTAFDLLLLDINLPGMNGLDLSHRLLARGISSLAVFLQSSLLDELTRAVTLGVPHAVFKDTLSQPNRWVGRVEEILLGLGGRKPAWLIQYHQTPQSVDSLISESDLTRLLEQGLGMERARRLGPALLDRLRQVDSLAVDSAPESVPAFVPRHSRLLAFHLLDSCWQLLGTEEIQGLRVALEPHLPGVSVG